MIANVFDPKAVLEDVKVRGCSSPRRSNTARVAYRAQGSTNSLGNQRLVASEVPVLVQPLPCERLTCRQRQLHISRPLKCAPKCKRANLPSGVALGPLPAAVDVMVSVPLPAPTVL